MNSHCACRLGYRLTSGGKACVRRHIDDACVEQDDCTYAVDHSSCYKQHCTCALGYHIGSDSYQCIARRLEENCTLDVHCLYAMKHSLCVDNQCRCQNGFDASSDRSHCVSWPDPRDVGIVAICVFAIAALVLLTTFLLIMICRTFVCRNRKQTYDLDQAMTTKQAI